MLCGGSRDDKVRAAFSLYDSNGDGFISLAEMMTYLPLRLPAALPLAAEIHGSMGVGADELAQVTAKQAFAEADLNHDGKLSFGEFERWFTRGGPSPVEVAGSLVSLEEARQLTNLQAYDIGDLLSYFSASADAGGNISQHAFFECFAGLLESGVERSASDLAHIEAVLRDLFALFDRDGNGVVDMSELGAGLSVLCGGTRDDKVRAAFVMFDTNGDGFISLVEMVKYLASVYKVLYQTSPETRGSLGVSPEQLAEVTARQCFAEADLNHDGRLSFEEFQAWYAKPSAVQLQQLVEQPAITLAEVRHLTNLSSYSVDTIFELFAECADEQGVLSKPAFTGCFRALIESDKGRQLLEPEKAQAKVIIDRLFQLFDTDGNRVVSFDEFASGISVLCGGSREDKVRAAFALFDLNGDGVISLDEATLYLTSVFKVLFETQPETRERMGVSAEELGRLTAEQAFAEADLNHDGKLSFEEFQAWYSEPRNGDELVGAPTADVAPVTMEEIQRWTQLDAKHVEEAFEVFAGAANDEGSHLSRRVFPVFCA